jgi:hypothetical protein
MELDFFLVTVIGGLLIYFYIQKRNDSRYFERNYYYKRFLRNKLQAEKNIKELDIIIKLCSKDELMLTKNGATSPEEYQFQLQHDYQVDYCNKILKKIKKNNLKNREKKRFAKMLSNQSEKLYTVEIDIALFYKKHRKTNCISTSQTHV